MNLSILNSCIFFIRSYSYCESCYYLFYCFYIFATCLETNKIRSRVRGKPPVVPEKRFFDQYILLLIIHIFLTTSRQRHVWSCLCNIKKFIIDMVVNWFIEWLIELITGVIMCKIIATNYSIIILACLKFCVLNCLRVEQWNFSWLINC